MDALLILFFKLGLESGNRQTTHSILLIKWLQNVDSTLSIIRDENHLNFYTEMKW